MSKTQIVILLPTVYLIGVWVTSYVLGRFTAISHDDSTIGWVLAFWPLVCVGAFVFLLGKYLIWIPGGYAVDRLEAAFTLGRSRRKQLELRERP